MHADQPIVSADCVHFGGLQAIRPLLPPRSAGGHGEGPHLPGTASSLSLTMISTRLSCTPGELGAAVHPWTRPMSDLFSKCVEYRIMASNTGRFNY
jgi:hypothetical protein